MPPFRPIRVAIRVQESAGHGGGMPMSMRVESEPARWAFVPHHLGEE